MSKAVKTIVSVAAAIAIPFVAPAIAGAIGASMGISAASFGVSATVGSTLGTAAVGAGLGAAKGAVLGEDIGRNALMGGISGGIAGYATAPVAAPANVGSAGYVPGGTAGAFGPAPYGPVDAASAFPLGAPEAAGLSSAGSFAAPGAAPSFGPAGYVEGGTAGSFAAPAAQTFGAPAAAPLSAAPSGAGLAPPKTFAEALGRVPGEIAGKFNDPKTLADLTLRAGGQLAGSLIAGDGLSSEEQALLNAQAEELRGLQQTNRDLFNQKMQAAQDLIGESKYFDPEYFGLQRARRAQIAGAVAKRGGLRGLSGDRRMGESRRYDLATGRDTATAFDQGFGTGTQGRLQTRAAGLAAMPGYLNYSTPAITEQMRGLDYGRARQRETEEGISKMFGSLTGRA